MRLIFLRGVSLLFSLILISGLAAQPAKKTPKYNSLFWEISGNGLKKPSYLFGTMHVSSKMVFHLSDSFYHAIRNSDMVALELNPRSWQPEMFRMQEAEQSLRDYFRSAESRFINEKSFRLQRYEDNLRLALSEEPTIVNGLLYRNFQQQADFEENTYLDLYIYQTGRKLGKQAGGVEDYWETQKVIMEGFRDMAIERAKKKNNGGGYGYDEDENYYEIQKKLQEAYRKGDLDLLDSLEKKMETSAAFNEKFLYKRNEIQANSIDSILQKHSLFVGVGAAHLPGERGVIEMLRRKGYRLRPIFMQNRDAAQKENVDKMRVPVEFKPLTTADGFVKMSLPGPLFTRGEVGVNPSWQYADMENGSYYMLTRVATHAAMLGEDESVVLKKVDSLLYENIPGKILVKKSIERNGYRGFDITNRTRRGDIQRYHIFVTPFEVLVFKMSGNDDYVQGKEANEFFSSISLRELNPKPLTFEPAFGGFRIDLPHEPYTSLRRTPEDLTDTWFYEAADRNTGQAWMVWKKTIQSFGFIEEDTFDLSLVEESLRHSEMIDKELNRSFGTQNGYPVLNMDFALKNGGVLHARAFIKGPHYYLVARRAGKKNGAANPLASFTLTDIRQQQPVAFRDSFYNFRVNAGIMPAIDNELRDMYEAAFTEEFLNQTERYNYGKKDRSASFYSDTTGETVIVNITRFPKYYYSRDTSRFFSNEYNTQRFEKDMVLVSKERLNPCPGSFGYKYVFTDTNSSRKLVYAAILQQNRLFDIAAVTDTSDKNNGAVNRFINSFVPEVKDTVSLFRSKLDQFFADLNSRDSLTRKRAMDAAAQLYFGPQSIPRLKAVIDSLKWGDKDYFELKSKFINELGYIDDSCCVKEVTDYLNKVYERTADTAYFQNSVLLALARLKTNESYASLKEHLLQDPPIFDNENDLGAMFGHFADTLQLSRSLFPEILQLMTIDDYKYEVTSLLRTMVDSGLLVASDYEKYFSNIYFDAKIELKRQQSADVKQAEKETQKEQNGDEDADRSYRSSSSDVDNYAVLLMPFYQKNAAIQKFFDKLLQSKDLEVRMNTAVLMIRNNVKVHDSVLLSVAEKDQFRAALLRALEEADKEEFFPKAFKKQEDIARSLLLEDRNYEKFFDVQMVGKQHVQVKNRSGFVYFFRYKLKREDDWKIGLSGIQPEAQDKVSSDNFLVSMTGKKLTAEETEAEQFQKQLKRQIYSLRRSSSRFYQDNRNPYGNFTIDRDYGEDED